MVSADGRERERGIRRGRCSVSCGSSTPFRICFPPLAAAFLAVGIFEAFDPFGGGGAPEIPWYDTTHTSRGRHPIYPQMGIAGDLLVSQASAAEIDSSEPVSSDLVSGEPSTPSAPMSMGDDPIEGIASYYADRFVGRRMANGQKFSQDQYTAAMLKVPLGTKVTVEYPKLGTSVQVTVTDRGPYEPGRVIDLTKTAFQQLTRGSLQQGLIRVRVIVPKPPTP